MSVRLTQTREVRQNHVAEQWEKMQAESLDLKVKVTAPPWGQGLVALDGHVWPGHSLPCHSGLEKCPENFFSSTWQSPRSQKYQGHDWLGPRSHRHGLVSRYLIKYVCHCQAYKPFCLVSGMPNPSKWPEGPKSSCSTSGFPRTASWIHPLWTQP